MSMYSQWSVSVPAAVITMYGCRTQSQPKTTDYSTILVVHNNAIFHKPLGKKILLSAHLLWIMADKTIKGESLEAAPPIPGLFFRNLPELNTYNSRVGLTLAFDDVCKTFISKMFASQCQERGTRIPDVNASISIQICVSHRNSAVMWTRR